jgi:hypothetical protein
MVQDPKSHSLRIALAKHHGVEALNVVVGEGVDGLLSCVATLLVADGDAVVSTSGTYPTFSYFIAGRGGVVHNVSYGADDRVDLPGLLTKARETNAKAIYLTNPDNPSGTEACRARVQARPALVTAAGPCRYVALGSAHRNVHRDDACWLCAGAGRGLLRALGGGGAAAVASFLAAFVLRFTYVTSVLVKKY